MAQQHAMKRIVATVLVSVAATGAAIAADLPPPVAPPPRAPAVYVPAPPVYNWTGFYLGINGGWGFGKSDWSVPGFSTGNFNVNGGLVGGTLGFNWWADGWVLGVEGDFDGSWMDGKSSLSVLQFNAKPRASGSPHCDRASATLPTASCST